MSESTVTLSVIIPVYNAEDTIRETLDSVLGQSLTDIEVICVDDGSRDSSVEIIREYMTRDPRVSLITQQNRYAGVARNAGIEAAKGEYLFFLDADDYVLDYALEAVCAKAEKHDLDCLKFLAMTRDEKEERYVDKRRNNGGMLRVGDYGRLLKAEKDSPLLRVSVTPWSGIYRRAFVQEKHCWFNSLKCVNDRSFWTKVMTNADRIMISRDRVTVHRENQDHSLVGRRAANFDCQIDSVRLTEKQLREDGIPQETTEVIMGQEYQDLVYWYRRFSASSEWETKIMAQIREYLDSEESSYGPLLQERLENMQPPAPPPEEVRPFHNFVPEPVVSVLVPVRGEEELLDRALDSLTNQTLEEMEFLLLDDGSSALCRTVMKEYAAVDRRFRIIDVSDVRDDGQMMNRGLEQAGGEYIGLLESRDFVRNDMYERLLMQARKHRLDLVMSDYTRFRITPDGELQTQSAALFENRNLYYRIMTPEKKRQVLSMPAQSGNGLYCCSLLMEGGNGREGFRDRALAVSRRARFLRTQLYREQAREGEAFIPDGEERQEPEQGLARKLRKKIFAGRELIMEYGMGYTLQYAREKIRMIRETHRQQL